MELSDFSSLIEVGTTLNIAFVAVEYVQSYTKVLYNQVFNLRDELEKSFDIVSLDLVDEDTLNHIQPKTINGKSTGNRIEAAKREREKLCRDIQYAKDDIETQMKIVFSSKSVSSISLLMFFYGLTALFLCGHDVTCQTNVFWTCFSICTFIYAAFGWAEIKSRLKVLRYSSLRHAIIAFFIFLSISILLSQIFGPNVQNVVGSAWMCIVFASLVLLYSNFVASVIQVWNRARQIRNKISESSQNIKDKCNTLKHSVNQLLGFNQVLSELDAEENV